MIIVRVLARLYRRFLLDSWRHIDRECAAEAAEEERARLAGAQAADQSDRRGGKRSGRRRAKTPAPRTSRAPDATWYDWRVIVVLVVVAVSLALQEYYGDRGVYREVFPYDRDDPYWTLKGFAWWSGWRFFGYVIIPMVAIWLMPGERVRDYYLSGREFWRHFRIYLLLFVLVFPVVVIAAQNESFYRTYPFYKWSNRSSFDFLAWQGLYALQFLSLEFFFRGFMLRGLGRAMGSKAIFVMIVPYCMIHFGKPLAETLGAIFAGIILGTLAMRTRSMWGGVVIHIGVAVTMDVLALGHCPPAESNLPCKGH
ncbi:MAG: CPBP family intramembrane metalloprotease [Proteobacteria bacterium]|nr:CPBP family intramembrane metalloprotease [Pseudomonadota bacterium]